MAIDVFEEAVMTLSEAAKRLPKRRGGKRPHVSTLYRWALGGCRARDGMIVRLEWVKVGGTLCTSQQALQRFFDRLTGEVRVEYPPSPTRWQRLREIQQAEEELRRAGI